MVGQPLVIAALLLATAAQAAPTSSAAGERPLPVPALTLGAFLSSNHPPQLLSSDEDHPCAISRVGDKRLEVTLFDGLVPDARKQKSWSWPLRGKPTEVTVEEMTEACGDELGPLLDLAIASCNSASSLEASLSTIATLELKTPPLAQNGSPPVQAGYWEAARELGCARTVASTDGRARIWTSALEKLGEASAKPIRGSAFLQWKDGRGTLHVFSDASPGELHLDAIIDSLVPVPGAPDELAILGLRAYATTARGKLPRRFAEVVRLNDKTSTAELVHGAFRSGDKEFDQLLVSATDSTTGKLRRNPLASRRLQLDPSSGELRLESIPELQLANPSHPPRVATTQVVARRSDGHFLVDWPAHSELSMVQSW